MRGMGKERKRPLVQVEERGMKKKKTVKRGLRGTELESRPCSLLI